MARQKQQARKRRPTTPSEDLSVENDGDGYDRPTKRTKLNSSSSRPTQLQPQKDSEGNIFWEISRMRRVTVSEFKGKQMVSVREFYEQNGETKPGKKGISMPIDQFSAFVELLPQIEKELARKGETVPRPHYDAPVKEDGEGNEESLPDVDDDDGVPKKSNIEATSDEDED